MKKVLFLVLAAATLSVLLPAVPIPEISAQRGTGISVRFQPGADALAYQHSLLQWCCVYMGMSECCATWQWMNDNGY